jgi:hypothetical protein
MVLRHWKQGTYFLGTSWEGWQAAFSGSDSGDPERAPAGPQL